MILQRLLNVIFYNLNQGVLMFHIVNNFPIQHSFLATTHSGDTVILKDDAVYAAKQGNLEEYLTKRAFSHLNLCVNKADLLQRNISKNELIHGVAVIDGIDEYQEYLAQNMLVKSYN